MTFKKFNSHASDEWFTPSVFIEAARATMGGITLDPFSCPEANETVKADRIFDIRKGQDGFLIPWYGNVWCNPPYGDQASKACFRAIEQFQRGRAEQVIILVRGDSEGLTALYTECFMWCDPGRISFNPATHLRDQLTKDAIAKGRKTWNNSPVPGSKIFYLGHDTPKFRKNFLPLGLVFHPALEE